MVEYKISMIAKKYHELTELSKKTGVLAREVMIVDLDGFGIKHLVPQLIDYMRGVAGIFQAHFPEVLSKSIVVNAPKVFHMGWGAVKNILEPGVQQKFLIAGKDYMDVS
jgi:hypothetical protein